MQDFAFSKNISEAINGQALRSCMRQAILFIHGIGEQRPMNTLRSFVEAVLPEPVIGTGEKYWSKPDPLAATYELRRLVTHRRLGTDFEYYWAHHVKTISLKSIIFWSCSLILRRKKNVPPHLLTFWRLSRISLAVIVAMIIIGSAIQPFSFLSKIPWFVGAAVVGIGHWWIAHYIGDAAQYLSPAPTNILMRQRIREEGVNILPGTPRKKIQAHHRGRAQSGQRNRL